MVATDPVDTFLLSWRPIEHADIDTLKRMRACIEEVVEEFNDLWHDVETRISEKEKEAASDD